MSVAFNKYMSKIQPDSIPKQKPFQISVTNPQVLRKYDMVLSSSNIKPKPNFSINITNNISPKHPEKTLRCIDENTKPLIREKIHERKPPMKFDELTNQKNHRRSNTQFIEDMKNNISMQFEKLKEFQETRTVFHQVLQEKENEIMSSKVERIPMSYEKNGGYEESSYNYRNNFSQEKQEKPTVKKEAKREETNCPYDLSWRKKYGEDADINNKYVKSISCHFLNTNNNFTGEEEGDTRNEVKISNKFVSNKTSNFLYGQMKIQEKKMEIDGKVSNLKQIINKAKRNGNMQMKEIYNLYEDLNECYKGLNEISENMVNKQYS